MKGWNKEEGEDQGRRRLDAAHSRDARQWAGVGGDGARDPRSFPRVCFIYKKKDGWNFRGIWRPAWCDASSQYVCASLRMFKFVYMCICVDLVYVSMYVHMSMCVCMKACVYVCKYVCMSASLCLNVCLCTFV